MKNRRLKTLEKEIPGWDFEKTRIKTEKEWENLLSRIQIKGTQDQKVQFYSALYRVLNQPTDYSEFGQYMSGASGEWTTYKSGDHKFFLDDWALWDTFRSTHPLQILIEPEMRNDVIWSLTEMYKQSGWFPNCTSPENGINQTMIGHGAAPIIADAYQKGFLEYDVETAYEGLKKIATHQHPDLELSRIGITESYRSLGYCPGGDDDTEDDTFSVSMTLELAYDDWCTAVMAKDLKKWKDYNFFIREATNYCNVFDPEIGFMRPKHSNAKWNEPFDPADSFKNGFCECSSWEYTFFVPHDVQGLMNLIGGKEALIQKLDDFFLSDNFNYQNETSLQVPYFYSIVGAPWKAQEIIGKYMHEKFNSRPDGLYGEDDTGAMSAWYMFNVWGFYPVCPGRPYYVIGTPMLPEVSYITEKGKNFSIKAIGVSQQNKYIKSAVFNGKPFNRAYLTHDEIINGGELVFEMDLVPNTQWGKSGCVEMFSMTTNKPEFYYSDIDVSQNTVRVGVPFEISLTVKNKGISGAQKVDVYDNDEIVASQIVFLEENNSNHVLFTICLYEKGFHNLKIGNVTIDNLEIVGVKQSTAEYEKVPRVSRHFVHAGVSNQVQAYCDIKNTGSFELEEKVELYLNGLATQEQIVKIGPGKKQEIKFEFSVPMPGVNTFKIGDSGLKEIYSGETLSEQWCHKSTTQAEYFEADRHLFIKAAGFENRNEFGIAYLKEKVTGDFTLTIQILYEENTSPYAPAGIIVGHDLSVMDEDIEHIQLGAMSKRGYYFYTNYEKSSFLEPYRYATGCPSAPCWLKIKRIGDIFEGFYSTDGEEWILINRLKCLKISNRLHYGLFVNSASPEMRLVEFDFPQIEQN